MAFLRPTLRTGFLQQRQIFTMTMIPIQPADRTQFELDIYNVFIARTQSLDDFKEPYRTNLKKGYQYSGQKSYPSEKPKNAGMTRSTMDLKRYSSILPASNMSSTSQIPTYTSTHCSGTSVPWAPACNFPPRQCKAWTSYRDRIAVAKKQSPCQLFVKAVPLQDEFSKLVAKTK